MRDEEYERVEVTARFIMKSENGVLLEFTNARGLIDQKWFPLSQLADKHDVGDGNYSMTMPSWLAESRGVA